MTVTTSFPKISIKTKMAGIYTVLTILCLMFIGFEIVITKGELERDFLQSSVIAASSLTQHDLETFTGSLSDTALVDYSRLKNKLAAISKAIPSCRFVYLMGEKNNNIFFYVDSEPANSKDISLPGQIYSEASLGIRNSFITKKICVEGPYTDRWGTWVMAIIPIINPANGKLIAELGIDVSSANWNMQIAKSCAMPVAVVLIAFFLVKMGIG